MTLRTAAWHAGVVGGRAVPFATWVRLLVGDTVGSAVVRLDPTFDIADPIGGPLRGDRVMGEEVRALVRVLVDRWSGR